MNILKNILSVIGGLVLVGAIVSFFAFNLGDKISKAGDLDPKAMSLYMEMADGVLNTGDAAATMVYTVKVDEDITKDEVIDSLKTVAMDNNMLVVSDTIMFRSGEKDVHGNTTRHVEILAVCNKQIARQFIDYSEAFGAFMPCRVILTEDKEGNLWLSTLKLDLMIAGGKPLTPEMLAMAEKVRDTMYSMVDKAAVGDF
ncbi:MAG TPA: DUF302 domain-containing protein [Helicobacteraceae bacterium]|nr:DUF302 domain-containing protein [Helicobacteraceae bacterium]